MKTLNILLLIIIGIIFTSCSDKPKIIQKPIPKEPKKQKVIQKKIDNYKKALSYEDKDGVIKGDNYANYKHYLDKAVKEKNPQAYLKAFHDYKNPIGKRAYIKGKYITVAQDNIKKASKFALLAIENRKNRNIACETIKEINKQYILNEEQSYKVYFANKKQKCIDIEDKYFDFQFTPSISFINKTINNDKYRKKHEQVLQDLIDNYAQKAIDGTLITTYLKYDDRWIALSKSAVNLAFINYKKDNKELAGDYLALAKKIIESTPLNKNRYFRYDLKEHDSKKYYHDEERAKIIKLGSDEILKVLLKMI